VFWRFLTPQLCWRTCLQAKGGRAFGTVYYVSGEQYKGEWRDNKRHGGCALLHLYATAQQQFRPVPTMHGSKQMSDPVLLPLYIQAREW
jgi:hypothetical protein